jgi:hypothetical protein
LIVNQVFAGPVDSRISSFAGNNSEPSKGAFPSEWSMSAFAARSAIAESGWRIVESDG